MKGLGRFLLWLLIIAEVGVFLVVLPILAWKGEMHLNEFLRVASLVVSWPVAATIMVLIFVSRFHEVIDIFLRKVGSMKLPGGIELQRQEPFEPSKEDDDAPGVVVPALQTAEKVVEELKEVPALSVRERSELEAQVSKLLQNIQYWKFAYLSLFFVEETKKVVNWVASKPQYTLDY